MNQQEARRLVDVWNERYPDGTSVQMSIDGVDGVVSVTTSGAWAKQIGSTDIDPADREWRPAVHVAGQSRPVDLTRVRPLRRPSVSESDREILDKIERLCEEGIGVRFELTAHGALQLLSQLQLASLHPLNSPAAREVAQAMCRFIVTQFPPPMQEVCCTLLSQQVNLEVVDWMNEK